MQNAHDSKAVEWIEICRPADAPQLFSTMTIEMTRGESTRLLIVRVTSRLLVGPVRFGSCEENNDGLGLDRPFGYPLPVSAADSATPVASTN
jgi:hypothetical protein